MILEDHNPEQNVELEAACGSDLDVVNAARVSLGNRSYSMNEKEKGLIRYLMRNKHGTPFEHNFFKFRVRAPIFVFREWHRHRIGVSINEMSGRYVELEDSFHVPYKYRTQTDKPGDYKFEPLNDPQGYIEKEHVKAYAQSWNSYQELLKQGVAKEQARSVLPVGIFSEMIWSCNARSLMAFLELRNAPAALKEIREYAAELEEQWSEFMPVTHEAFLENDRIAP